LSSAQHLINKKVSHRGDSNKTKGANMWPMVCK
jgi:hypothetical protein